MGKYIKFGKYNKNYKFIFLSAVCMFFLNILTPTLFNILFCYNKISENVYYIYQHTCILNIFKYLGTFIFSCFLLRYERKFSKRELNSETNILIIITISVIFEFLGKIFPNLILNIFNYYMYLLLITPFINVIIFKIKIYKHQKCAIFFNFVVAFIFELCSFILIIKSNEKNNQKKFIKVICNILIGFFIYLLIGTILSYAYSKMKWFMNYNYISLAKLFMNYTLVSLSIYTIISIILTFINCDKLLCPIKKDDFYYLENISIFFEKISIICRENKADLIFIICSLILEILCLSFYLLFFLLILKNLYPEHYYFSLPILNLLTKIYGIFELKILKGYYFSEGKDYKLLVKIFVISIIEYSLTIIGFLIYLEIIELNFCGFNYNLRKNIVQRGIEDVMEDINVDDEQNENLIDDKTPNKSSELLINN